MSGLDFLALTIALLCGISVGFEREVSGKSAGLRTNVLICIGAAIFTIISKKMGIATGASQVRIAAGIVTGVGFLGAGAVIQDQGGVFGLTTAATIWLVASIGMACGAGYFAIAIVSTVMTLVVLIGLHALEIPLSRFLKKRKNRDHS